MMEDDSEDAELIKMLLKQSGYNITSKIASDKKEFIKAIEEDRFDVILADNSLPQFNSVDALSMVQAKNLDTPFILVTGTISEEFAVNILHKGADDYILKGNPKRLPAAIEMAIEKRNIKKEKIRAEIALKESEMRFRVLFEQALDGIIIVNEEGEIIDTNEKACTMMGYKKEELINHTMLNSFFIDEPAIGSFQFKELKKGKTILAERKLKQKDGSPVNVELSAKLLPDQRYQVIIRDITRRKNAETALNESNDQLRQLASHLQDVREEERASMAREIHDELGQQLTAIKLELSIVELKSEGGNPVVLQKIRSMAEMLNKTMKTVREMAAELRPGIIDDLGLVEAINWVGIEFEKRADVKVEFHPPGTAITIADNMAIALFRIYQESLTNIARHANASRVVSGLEKKDDKLVLSITDNGKGFNPASIGNKKTLGILGMKERALMIGGIYEINSKPGCGTTVLVSLPYGKEQDN